METKNIYTKTKKREKEKKKILIGKLIFRRSENSEICSIYGCSIFLDSVSTFCLSGIRKFFCVNLEFFSQFVVFFFEDVSRILCY